MVERMNRLTRWITVADQGGGGARTPPPKFGLSFFIFKQYLTKTWFHPPHLRVPPPPNKGNPESALDLGFSKLRGGAEEGGEVLNQQKRGTKSARNSWCTLGSAYLYCSQIHCGPCSHKNNTAIIMSIFNSNLVDSM